MSIGLGITIWLDSSHLRRGAGPTAVKGGLVTRAFATARVVTRGYYFVTVFRPSLITRGYGAKNAVTRGLGGPV
jgi:hypothetical protein